MTRLLDDVDLRVDRHGELPVGTQLAGSLRALIQGGHLRPGDRLPSIRELAVAAGVNVNTVRTVYARLEREGVTSTEHGRGTFVAAPTTETSGGSDRTTRRALRREIARLERELVRRPHPPTETPPLAAASSGQAGNLLTTEQLQGVHDTLLDRLRELDAERADVIHRLSELEYQVAEPEAAEPERRSTTSLSGARVRWVGAG